MRKSRFSEDQIIDGADAIIAETKLATCPEAIVSRLSLWSGAIERIGMETGPLAIWLWNTLSAKQLPIICMDAPRQRSAEDDAQQDRPARRPGLAQIVRTG